MIDGTLNACMYFCYLFLRNFRAGSGHLRGFLSQVQKKMMIFDLQWNLMESCLLVTEALIT